MTTEQQHALERLRQGATIRTHEWRGSEQIDPFSGKPRDSNLNRMRYLNRGRVNTWVPPAPQIKR